jgi:hypothetical protein
VPPASEDPNLWAVRLFGEWEHPAVQINDHRPVDYRDLPVTGLARSSLAVWLSVAGAQSGHTRDDMLVAGARAAALVARDVGNAVRVTFTMRDGQDGQWLRFDVGRS